MTAKEEKILLKELQEYIRKQNEDSDKKKKQEFWHNFSSKVNVITAAFYMLTTIFIFTYITDNSQWRGKVDNILKTDSTIAALRLRQEIRNQLGAHLSLNSYFEIESARSEAVSQVFVDFGRILGIKEEELEYFKKESIRKMNSGLRVGTSRNKK